MSTNFPSRNPWTAVTWIAIAVVSVAWWVIAGQGSLQRSVLLILLSLACFSFSLMSFLYASSDSLNSATRRLRVAGSRLELSK